MRCFVFAGWDGVAAIAFAGGSLFSKQGGLESRKLMLVSCFNILGEPAEKIKKTPVPTNVPLTGVRQE